MVACGEADDLYGPAVKLVQHLRDGGHPDVQFVSACNMAHGFDKRVQTDETRKARDEMYAKVGEMIAASVK